MNGARRRGAARLVAFVLLVAGMLAGCASIPQSGPVVHGKSGDSDPGDREQFQIIPNGPAPGASAAGIVEGFLKAAAGFGDDHRVARSFLTSQRRLAWQPDASVVVYPGQSALKVRDDGAPPATAPTPTPTETIAPGQSAGDVDGPTASPTSTPAVADPADVTRVTVQTPVSARIDGDGHYKPSQPGDTQTATFTLVRSDGQWRISQLGDGILVSQGDFDVTFRAYPVYYTDPAGRYLVPDLRWFASSRDEQGAASLATTLVRVLLAGPPSWLENAVISGAPAGTRMDAAVVVSDQVATIDLNEAVRAANTRARQLLLSQLQTTLGQLSDIVAVQITVNRQSFDVPSGSGSGSSDAGQEAAHPVVDPQVSGLPVVIDAKGRLDRLDNSTLTEVPDVTGLEVKGANRPAVSADGSSAYAVLDGKRHTLLLQAPGAKAVALVHGTRLTAPSFDPDGWVWTSPGLSDGYVYAGGVDSAGSKPVKVKAPWTKGYTVEALRISRDGTRAALAITYRGHAHLFVTGVVRDAQGVPVALNQATYELPDLTSVQDVAWMDDEDLVVLGRRAGTTEQPWLLQLGGTVRAATAVSGAAAITAGNGETSILAGTTRGTYARAGARWTRETSARWPAYSG
jgi:hypothetical protein